MPEKVAPDRLGMGFGFERPGATSSWLCLQVTFHQPRLVPQRHLSTDIDGWLIPRIVPGAIGTAYVRYRTATISNR
jgi:hypothetical protein